MPRDVPAATPATLIAPPKWEVIDFVSDLHLSAETPRSLHAFEAYLRDTPAQAVFILGDLFEVWVGDDARDGPFETCMAASLSRSAATRVLAFMAGNRDFLLGERMLDACGMRGLTDPTVLVAQGQRILLTHGDSLCVADVDYQRFREQVRNAQWQEAFLARPLAERRALAAEMRRQSRERQRLQPPDQWFDVDTAAALRWLSAADADVMIHGHTHRPGSHAIDAGHVRQVLSDWDLDDDSRSRADVLRLHAGALSRIAVR